MEPEPAPMKESGRSQRRKPKRPSETTDGSNIPKNATAKENSKKLQPPNIFTCIICAENADFYAVGACDHPICSLCALRIRLVSKEKDCVICKQQMDFMVVSMFRNCVQPFQSFGLFADAVAPGVRIDHSSCLHFVNCAKHFKDLDTQRDITCSLCCEKFRHRKDLSKHLSSVHEVCMCPLCLDNLRLFVCEQQLYTKNELKLHMNGKPGGPPGMHPLCQFCKVNLFDSMQLYVHMRDRHFSCYLCPSAHQHRFYKNISDLELHFKHSHITCVPCFSQTPVGARSYCVFRCHSDYRDHMSSEHNVYTPSNSTNHLKVAFKFSSKSSSAVGDTCSGAGVDDIGVGDSEPAFLDLFLPEQADSSAASSRSDSAKPKHKIVKGLAKTGSQLLQLVPEHMRVAGRVTGTGLFTRDASDDLLEQHSRDMQRGQRSGYAARVSSNASAVRYNNMYDFPTLANEGGSSAAADQPLHPLSLVSQLGAKSVKPAAASATATAAAEPKKRSDAFAEALGIDLNHPRSAVHIHPVGQETAALPVYPPNLLSWAVKNSAILTKTENRISTFLEDNKVASLQLPPMQRPIRDAIHSLALYYGLTSHEFDQDPKRYISLVKGPSSKIPACLLSVAAQKPWISVASYLKKGINIPVIYISFQGPQKIPVFVSTIVHRVDSLLSEICAAEFHRDGVDNSNSFNTAMKILRPLRVELFNASTIMLEFSSAYVASRIHATLAANTAQLGENVLIIPGFTSLGPNDLSSNSNSMTTDGFIGVQGQQVQSAWGDITNTQASTDNEEDCIVVSEKPKTVPSEAILSNLHGFADEDEWETIDTKEFLVAKKSTERVAPVAIPCPFPKVTNCSNNEHFVASIPEDPEIIAKREQEWVKFLDDHKRKPQHAGSNDPEIYRPPSHRLQSSIGIKEALNARIDSGRSSSAIGQKINMSYEPATKLRSIKAGAYVSNLPNKAPLSFSMLQLDDSTSSDEDK